VASYSWCQRVGENASLGGQSSRVGGPREEQGTGAPFPGGTGQGRSGRSEGDDGPHFVDHSALPGQAPNREDYIRDLTEDQAAFSDFRFIIEDQAAEGDKVISRCTISAIHDRGEVLGFTPTGRKIETTYISIHRIEGGKIAEEWSEGGGLLELTQQRLEQEIRERERVEHDLRVARSIQQASLPKEVPILEGWEINPFYQPAREVGGDFYEFFELEDGKVGLAVGDATGKGIPAALAVTASSSMLRAVARDSGYSPGEVLERVNETLLARIPQNMFVTCFYAILEPNSGSLVYANAGHNLPCCRHEPTATTTDLSATGMPLGLMAGMSYEEKESVLAPGEGMLFYTEGLIEAHNPQGEMFGTLHLRGLLSELPMGGADLSATLLEELYSFTGEGWEQEDDITLLTLECSATRS
jgi:serine phosphatase RsbU (regulator of sigma subunit)/predicted ester cyclase